MCACVCVCVYGKDVVANAHFGCVRSFYNFPILCAAPFEYISSCIIWLMLQMPAIEFMTMVRWVNGV